MTDRHDAARAAHEEGSPHEPTDRASDSSAPDATDLERRVRRRVRDIPDFPEPGILFRDITPVLADAPLFEAIVAHHTAKFAHAGIEVVAGIESRGFILGAAIAAHMGVGFVPIRKPGKLPYEKIRVDYDLEYGSDALEAHVDAIQPGQTTLIIDDLLATGGTASGAVGLVRRLGGRVHAVAVLIELAGLDGRLRLGDTPLSVLVRYD